MASPRPKIAFTVEEFIDQAFLTLVGEMQEILSYTSIKKAKKLMVHAARRNTRSVFDTQIIKQISGQLRADWQKKKAHILDEKDELFTKIRAYFLFGLAEYYQRHGQLEIAISFLNRASNILMKVYESTPPPPIARLLIDCHNNLAICFVQKEDETKAIDDLLTALALSYALKDKKPAEVFTQARLSHQLARLSFSTDSDEETITACTNTLRDLMQLPMLSPEEEVEKMRMVVSSHLMLAQTYYEKKDYPSAIHAAQSGLIHLRNTDPAQFGENRALLNRYLGLSHFHLKNYPEAKAHFKASFSFFRSLHGDKARATKELKQDDIWIRKIERIEYLKKVEEKRAKEIAEEKKWRRDRSALVTRSLLIHLGQFSPDSTEKEESPPRQESFEEESHKRDRDWDISEIDIDEETDVIYQVQPASKRVKQ